ncbi:uncharacterized protein LOC134824839 isoform X3 [Bolinopsis microptera]|uniref:uncharacterized protein LOC134824839 isoform X3 n=1 Tax=Bolinopsis microptera TaxID=2820187 RepID=UPI003079D390
MQEISNVGIAVLVLGTILISVLLFLVLMGNHSNLEKRLTKCVMGTSYLIVLIAITFCKRESFWARASVENVMIRVWASDLQDYESDIGVHLGLRGINITLKVKAHVSSERPEFAFNERFEWAWGTKNSMEDGSNPYKRTLKSAVRKGLPLPIHDLAESFETYGTLGPASAGLGVHEAGFFTDLFLTLSLVSWIIAGVLPPLSLYASLHAACISLFSLALSLFLYVVIFYSSDVMWKSQRYFQSAHEDSQVEFYLRFSWGFYINLIMFVVSLFLCFGLRQWAVMVRIKETWKMQQEVDEIKELRNKGDDKRNRPRGVHSRSSFKKVFKRRLTATWSRGESQCKDVCPGVSAVPLSEVIETLVAESSSKERSSNPRKAVICENKNAEAATRVRK